jgi:hypothetical protein
MNTQPKHSRPPIIVVHLRGGMVQETRSNIPLTVVIEDYDSQDQTKPSRYDLWPDPLDAGEEASLIHQFGLDEADAQTVSDEQIDGLIDELLEYRRQIAMRWSIEDVQEIRPDLDDDQAWEVLKAADRYHDASNGIHWDVLACHADMLFGEAPEADEA